MHLGEPVDIYRKGDEFKGIIFAKFNNADTVTEIVDSIRKKKETIGNIEFWCKPDRPIEIRSPASLLLGLRWQLIQWDVCAKNDVKVDDQKLTMKACRAPVLAVTIVEGAIKLDWQDDTWKTWNELQDSPELKKLIATANDKIVKSAAPQIKGKGKGPDRSGGTQDA